MRLNIILLFAISALLINCSITNQTIEINKSAEIDSLQYFYIALMPINEAYLSNDEIEDINDDLNSHFGNFFGYIKFLNIEQFELFLKSNNLWDKTLVMWNDYVETGVINKEVLLDIRKETKINTILFGQVLSVQKTFGKHRAQIGESTAEVKFTIFSTITGNVIWEAVCSGTQGNAHSDQPVPSTIEAVEVALDEIMHNLPFKSYYKFID